MAMVTNHLVNEKSLYLLQHAHNPVDWYPWSNEAFNLAKSENKPIFLSIGYSTCHWCHVMAHESFEDHKVANLLNESFVCIKVDREERPDIDKIYMNVCQLMTGRGGWPLTIIMTPDKKPFFAATYLPRETTYGMKGLLDLLPEIKNLWKNNDYDLKKSADKITNTLQNFTKTNKGQEFTKTILDITYNQLLNSYDELHGGFGTQPKFPTPHNLLFLLRYWKRTADTYALTMVETTLEQMRQGGIYDHIGFGFHRYSTDTKWILPHFEKMLYDQSLLILAYTEAYQATKKDIYKKTAEEIIEYVLRDMTAKTGGFYSAEDADSEGEEGKYYLWGYDELQQSLTSKEFDFVEKFYNIKKEGNFRSESGRKNNLNILHQTMNLKDFAQYYKIPEEKLSDNLENIRKKLYMIRKKRIHPQKDDKILTDWNGLMIAALAKAGQVFENNTYIIHAEKALRFILKNMMKKNGELLHRCQQQEAKISAYADDYAFLIFGLIELYQATFKTKYIKNALDLNNYLLKHFWDDTNGGLFFSSNTHEKILTRTKDSYDGALPSANSISLYNFIRLSRITGDTELEYYAIELSKAFSPQIKKMPGGYTQMMVGLDYIFGPSYEIVIVGDNNKKETKKILQYLHSKYQPNNIIIIKDIKTNEEAIEHLVPFIKEYSQIKNQTTIYVCRNQQCQLPVTDIEEMKRFLN